MRSISPIRNGIDLKPTMFVCISKLSIKPIVEWYRSKAPCVQHGRQDQYQTHQKFMYSAPQRSGVFPSKSQVCVESPPQMMRSGQPLHFSDCAVRSVRKNLNLFSHTSAKSSVWIFPCISSGRFSMSRQAQISPLALMLATVIPAPQKKYCDRTIRSISTPR